MKTKFFFFVLFLLLALGACMNWDSLDSLIPSVPESGFQAERFPLSTPRPQSSNSPLRDAARFIEPTAAPMVDYQATAYVALTKQETSRLEAQSANLAVAQYTADANLTQLERERIAQEALVLRAHGTEISINATGTAAQYIPLTATVQAQSAELNRARMTERAAEPTLIVANANSKTYAKYADQIQATTLWAQWILIAFVGCLTFFLLVKSMAVFTASMRERNEAQSAQVELKDLNLNEIENTAQYKHVDNEDVQYSVKRIKPDIPCTVEQLLFLADGIINRGMTLGIKQWEGTIVHRVMVGDETLRDWFVWNEFARELKSKGGELYVLSAGEKFLESTLAHGAPPDPYACLTPSPFITPTK